MFTVICDGCGADAFEGQDIVAWSDRSSALEVADCSDWSVLRQDGRHLCTACREKEEG